MIEVAAAAAEAHSWDWTWEALVAVSTIALAIVTGLLAFFTWRVASKTRDLAKEGKADRRAQWRPVLLPASDEFTPDPQSGIPGWGHGNQALTYNPDDPALSVRLRNTGRGPALYVRAQLERPEAEGRISPDAWSLGALAAGDSQTLIFRNARIVDHAQLLLDYRDLVGNAYATACTLQRQSNNPIRVYDVRTFENHTVTNLGDANYPQQGLTDVRPKPGRKAPVVKEAE